MSAVKRVVVTGPESTGKTTLARDLAAHYRTLWAPEFLRPYLDVKNAHMPPGSPVCEPGDLAAVVAGQTAIEEALARRAHRVLFCDTDPTTTAIYSQYYYGACEDWLRQAADERSYDLHLLLDVDVPWIPDAQRDRPHDRPRLYALFREALERRGRPFVVLSGPWGERFGRAVAAVNALLAAQ